MKRLSFVRVLAILSFAGPAAFFGLTSTPTNVRAQGGTCPVVPSTLGSQPYITVKADQDHVNIRSGPNSFLYDMVGLLLPGESAPALGRTSGGDWIQISCPGVPGNVGWIYSANVNLTSSGFLQIVESPPTPEIAFTLDATMLAAYDLHSTATRLPTFTPPAPPPSLPTYVEQSRVQPSGWVAPLISGFALAGLVGLLISFLFRR